MRSVVELCCTFLKNTLSLLQFSPFSDKIVADSLLLISTLKAVVPIKFLQKNETNIYIILLFLTTINGFFNKNADEGTLDIIMVFALFIILIIKVTLIFIDDGIHEIRFTNIPIVEGLRSVVLNKYPKTQFHIFLYCDFSLLS